MEQKSSGVFDETRTAVTFEIHLPESLSTLNMLYTGWMMVVSHI